MKYSIGYRTFKTALGTGLAIMMAHQLGLTNYATAGIMTILCVQVTKRKSLYASWERLLACILAMPFSALFFELFGYHPIVIGLCLLFFIPTLVMIKAKEGIVISTVIVLHFFSAGKLSKELFLNEFGITVVGIGVALIMNLYMPSMEKKLKEYQGLIEQNFRNIFKELIQYIRGNESNWDGREITTTAKIIDEAKTMAFRDVENHFLRTENFYYHYFKMREKQFEILERLLPTVASLSLNPEQSRMVGDFLEELYNNVHAKNTAHIYLNKLRVMKLHFESMELPKTRKEFNASAALFQFIKDMEEYLIIKSKFKTEKC